jgi:DNA modification methylase
MIERLESSAGQAPQYASSNGERNKLATEDRAFHDWYRFVLSYPAHLVRQYLTEFGLSEEDVLLDPFCGTGTTVVESKLQGIQSIGLEANRFAQFAGNVKVDWAVNPDALRDRAHSIAANVSSRLENQGIPDFAADSEIKRTTLQSLSEEQFPLILKDSINPTALHKSLTLLNEIDRYAGQTVHKYLRLAFAKALVFKISNLKFGPEVGVGKPRGPVPVVNEWLGEVEKMCDDLRQVDPTAFPFATVKLVDSRDIASSLKGTKISAVITSPPYPNEKDYTRTTRLESVVLGFIKDRHDLRSMKKTLLRSNTRGVYREDDDDKFVAHITEVQSIAEEIEAKRIDLEKTSGFERMYPRLTRLYFGGMARHLKDLQSVLKPGAMLAYVVGDQASYLRVMIRTGQILERIGVDLGYEKVRIDNFRTRFSTATKDWLNEEVVILRWPGKK